MAVDLLSTIHREIDDRLRELRPLHAEYERLLGAAEALSASGRDGSEAAVKMGPAKGTQRKSRVGTARRGSAAGAIERAGSPSRLTVNPQVEKGFARPVTTTDDEKAGAPGRSAIKIKSARAVPGAAREAILAALEHGSHTLGELVVVTAMNAPNVNGNLRKLFSEGAVTKTEREGKAAWALPVLD